MTTVGFIGWRGMVGSVLMERMRAEGDFRDIESTFFTTSNVGGAGPAIGKPVPPLKDASDITALSKNDILITCQGGDYTKAVIPSCAPRAGRATGSTRRAPFAWTRTPSSSWTR
jgi:aspartate-semialdehyde dehydrogenase